MLVQRNAAHTSSRRNANGLFTKMRSKSGETIKQGWMQQVALVTSRCKSWLTINLNQDLIEATLRVLKISIWTRLKSHQPKDRFVRLTPIVPHMRIVSRTLPYQVCSSVAVYFLVQLAFINHVFQLLSLEVPMHLGAEYHDADPLPVSRPPLPPPQIDEEDLAGGHYTTNRSNYFTDSRSFGYYSRYP